MSKDVHVFCYESQLIFYRCHDLFIHFVICLMAGNGFEKQSKVDQVRDICTLYAGACSSMLYTLPYQIKKDKNKSLSYRKNILN